MKIQLNEPGIRMFETENGLLVHGYLPGVSELDADIADEHVAIHGKTRNGAFAQELPLNAPVRSEHAILSVHDEQLRLVLPWRNT